MHYFINQAKLAESEIVEDLKRYEKFAREHTPYLIEEMEGVIRGAKVAGYEIDYYDILLINCFTAIAWARPAEEFRFDVADRCTSFAAWGSSTSDQKPIMAINKMLNWIATYDVILFGFPAEGHGNNFVTVPLAGCVAHNWGANAKGLAFMLTAEPCFRKGDANYGLLIEFMFRHIIQKCSTFEEAEAFLKTAKQGGSCGSWFLFDKESNHVVIERTAAHMGIRHCGDLGEKDYIVMANHFVCPEMIASNILGKPSGPDVPMIAMSYWRYENMHQLVKENLGEIDTDVAHTILRNHDLYDPESKQWERDAIATGKTVCAHTASLQGSLVLTSAISLPATNEVLILTGQPCGIGLPGGIGEYAKFKLGSDPSELNGSLAKESRLQVSLAQFKLANSKDELDLDEYEVIERYIKKAEDEWWRGLNWEKYAGLSLIDRTPENVRQSNDLYGSAWTAFAKAQAYAKKAVRLIEEELSR